MRAARAEVDDRSPLGGQHDARRLAGDDALEMDLVEHEGLDQLGLEDRGDHLHDRLVGKDRRAFRNRVYVAGEPQSR